MSLKPLSALRFLKPLDKEAREATREYGRGWSESRPDERAWEDHYRRRWQYDRRVRSTHGVNCTGSCSWNVHVKNGIVAWETQKTDYPACGKGFPNHEPRGCPRGATYSWYTYSPVRLKHPLIRSALMEMWRAALAQEGDRVAAWRSIAEDEEKRTRFHEQRGKGGFVRASWDEVSTLVAASLVHTIQKHGPDRIFGFTPIPAMSMVCYASGARFLSLLGAAMISFYDWYCDLPPASPQIWGEQTDVPESADWYDAAYMIVWGTNLPMTRTPDAHFYTEARYRGTRVAAVAADYAEYVKFADTWLPARAGTDAALALAMAHVILKEHYVEKPSPAFAAYAKANTDLPFVVLLKKRGEAHVSDRFLRADDLGRTDNNAEWKTMVFDSKSAGFHVPNGSVGFRWGEEGKWNLDMAEDGTELDPLLSFAAENDEWVSADFPYFADGRSQSRRCAVPVKRVTVNGEDR